MKSFAVVLALAAAAFAQFTVNTPAAVTECEPTQLSWSGGVPPYFPSIIPGGQVAAPALKTFPQQTGTTLTWNVDLQPQAINVQIKDSTGATQYSSIINIIAGSSSSCVSTSTAVNPIGGGGSPTGSPSGGSPPATTHASGSATGPNSTPTPQPNSAATVGARTIGFAMLAGLIGAALF